MINYMTPYSAEWESCVLVFGLFVFVVHSTCSPLALIKKMFDVFYHDTVARVQKHQSIFFLLWEIALKEEDDHFASREGAGFLIGSSCSLHRRQCILFSRAYKRLVLLLHYNSCMKAKKGANNHDKRDSASKPLYQLPPPLIMALAVLRLS